MANKLLPGELYNTKTFFTLSGASLGVWLFTLVLGSTFNIDVNHYKWIGLVVAIFLSLVGALSLEKLGIQQYTLIFFNGLLIYVTASGIDSINHSSSLAGQKVATASLIPNTNNIIWWPPQEMKDSIAYYKQTSKAAINDIADLKLQLAHKDSMLQTYNLQAGKPAAKNDDALPGIYKRQLEENLALKSKNKKLEEELQALTVKQSTTKSAGQPLDNNKINFTLSKENIDFLNETNSVCKYLYDNLKAFTNSGKPSPCGVAYLLGDVYQFQKNIEERMEKVSQLIKKYQ